VATTGLAGVFLAPSMLRSGCGRIIPLQVIRQIADAALKSLCGGSPRCIRGSDRGRSHRSGCCASYCCRCFIRSARSRNWSARPRPAVSLVCRARDRGPGVGCHHLHQEPRPAVGTRRDGQVSRRGVVKRQGQRLVVERSFLGRRNLVGGLASPKSSRLNDGSGEPPGPGRNDQRDFHGEQRTNDTHSSPPTQAPRRNLCADRGRSAGRESPCADWRWRSPAPRFRRRDSATADVDDHSNSNLRRLVVVP
jgi:hypothetical protein